MLSGWDGKISDVLCCGWIVKWHKERALNDDDSRLERNTPHALSLWILDLGLCCAFPIPGSSAGTARANCPIARFTFSGPSGRCCHCGHLAPNGIGNASAGTINYRTQNTSFDVRHGETRCLPPPVSTITGIVEATAWVMTSSSTCTLSDHYLDQQPPGASAQLPYCALSHRVKLLSSLTKL